MYFCLCDFPDCVFDGLTNVFILLRDIPISVRLVITFFGFDLVLSGGVVMFHVGNPGHILMVLT